MSGCVICREEVNWTKVARIFEHIFDRVDRRGEESLTESEQVVYSGHCCSEDCYHQLK